ncbi:MAG: type II secretion system protein J, partial [Phycisphaerae bacterium]
MTMHIAFDRNRGFTLIELMVSLGILAMMVLAFATILSQARSIVSGGQELLQEKSAVDAVARIMREDVRKASGHGVMCLTQDNDG